MSHTSLTALRTVQHFREHLDALDLDLPFDGAVLPQEESPLSEPLALNCGYAGNRWCIQPMAGWDAAADGAPTEHTLRRWLRFGESGAKLIWGCEAVAVSRAGRADPRQLELTDGSLAGLQDLRERMVAAHQARFGTTDDLVVGLQLTHAGRWAAPEQIGERVPRAAFRHPLLDDRVGVADDAGVISDGEIEEVIEAFVGAAVDAQQMGFQFVDLQHCHGYLLHELLSARTRPGPYGGEWAQRSRVLREIVEGIRRDAPGLEIGVRMSAFDLVPFRAGEGDEAGQPVAHAEHLPYQYGFGMNPDDPTVWDLSDAHELLDLLAELDIELVNVSAGSPYYTVHLYRPALYPAPGEYAPPEDPLVGVVRLLHAARDLKYHHPDAVIVGSGFSYLQDFLPHVAQAVVREEWVDFVGLGRIALPYPDLPRDVMEHGRLDRARICRTFSSCSAAPREGKISGCYPMDPHFGDMPDANHLRAHR